MTELALRAQEPMKAVPVQIQGVSVSCYGVKRHAVYKSTIPYLCVCDDNIISEYTGVF